MIQPRWVVAAFAVTVVSAVSLALLNREPVQAFTATAVLQADQKDAANGAAGSEARQAERTEAPPSPARPVEIQKKVLLQELGSSGSDSSSGGGTTADSLGDASATLSGLDAALQGITATEAGASGLGVTGVGVGGGGAMGVTSGEAGNTYGGLGTKGYGSGSGSGSGSGYGIRQGSVRTEGRVGRKDMLAPADDGVGGDQYGLLAENPFHTVGSAPLSTFSIDVDTAAYANVRRYLEEGTAPPRDAVRIEELLNYFPYDYAPPPQNGAPFAANAEVTEAPWAAGHQLVRVGIKGREIAARATPPRNLVFLVDVSGSMSGSDRLPLVQRGLSLLASQLGPEDHVALVVYAGAAGVVLEPTRGDRTATILDAIDRLRAGGSTAGAAGIEAAYALAGEHFRKGAINRVILATDGDFNVGVSNDSELLRLIEAKRESGVFLTVLGVGRGNLQDEKMELLADKGNGNYAYIDSYSEMRKVLGDQVGGTLDTIAKDVKIQVEFNPAKVASYRLLGYENRVLADRDFADDTKDAGEIGAGHTVTALYEVVPTAAASGAGLPLRYQGERALTPAALGTDELLTVKIRYKAPDGDVSALLSYPVPDRTTPFAQASTDTRWAAAVAGYGMLLRGSPHKGTLGWSWVRATAREALGADIGGYRAELLGLVEKARRIAG